MASSDTLRRVADRHAKLLVEPLMRALSRGTVDVAELAAAFERGDRRGAERLALESVDPQHLRVLIVQVNTSERLLDVMEDAGNAVRCAVRPTGESVSAALDALGPIDQQAQLQSELAVQRVESTLASPLAAQPVAPVEASVWPVRESPGEMETRLRRGYTEIVRVDAGQFAAEYEASQGNRLAYSPRKSDQLRTVAELDAYPQVTAGLRGDRVVVDVIDGRHRLALAAERGQQIDVAMSPESRAVFPLQPTAPGGTPSPNPSRPRRPWGLRTAAAGGELTDVVVTVGARSHGVNVTVFTTQRSSRLSVPPRLRRRLARWSRDTGVVLHSVAFDMRPRDLYSGHGYYYARGIRSMSLQDMTQVRDAAHLRELVRGADVSLL